MAGTYTNRLSEELAVLAHEPADSQSVGTHNSGWVLMENYHRAWFVLSVGNMGVNATLDAGLQQASDAAGTGAKAITGKTITQLTQAGADADSIVCIELQTEELDVDNGFEYIRFYVTVGTAAVEYAVVLFGAESRYEPVPITGWTEIVG